MEYVLIKHLLSFVIPCYRSEETIEQVCIEIKEEVAKRPEYNYEIIAVNDYSPDGVLDVLRRLAAEDNRIKVIDLAKNFGKHSALMAGFAFVRGEYVICLDDDCQCPIDRLWDMMHSLTCEEYDCATAMYMQKKEAAWKRLGAGMNAHIVKMMIEPPKGVEMENYFVCKRYVCDEILRYPNPYPYVGGLLMQATHRIKMIPMEERERGDNKSTGFTFRKSFSLFSNGLTAFSVKPLRIATLLGMGFALIGFVFGTVVVIRKLCNPGIIMGYSSLMAVQLFSCGVVLLVLGIIGEYLGRIYICLNHAPQYVIRERINLPPK